MFCVNFQCELWTFYRFQKLKINNYSERDKMESVTRNGQVVVFDKQLLEFCLIEVGKIQYNFHILEECVLSSSLDKKYSSFDLVNDTEIVNIVKMFVYKRYSST